MKLLFDQNLSFKLCRLLADLFPESEQIGKLGLGQADDLTVWRYARNGGFMFVTQDAYFADLAFVNGSPPKVIWLRCGNQTTPYVHQLLRDRSEAISLLANSEDSVCLEIY